MWHTGMWQDFDWSPSATVDDFFFSGRGHHEDLDFGGPGLVSIRHARLSCKRLVGCSDGCYIRVWMPCVFSKRQWKCAHVFGSGLHINGTEKQKQYVYLVSTPWPTFDLLQPRESFGYRPVLGLLPHDLAAA